MKPQTTHIPVHFSAKDEATVKLLVLAVLHMVKQNGTIDGAWSKLSYALTTGSLDITEWDHYGAPVLLALYYGETEGGESMPGRPACLNLTHDRIRVLEDYRQVTKSDQSPEEIARQFFIGLAVNVAKGYVIDLPDLDGASYQLTSQGRRMALHTINAFAKAEEPHFIGEDTNPGVPPIPRPVEENEVPAPITEVEEPLYAQPGYAQRHAPGQIFAAAYDLGSPMEETPIVTQDLVTALRTMGLDVEVESFGAPQRSSMPRSAADMINDEMQRRLTMLLGGRQR